MKTQSVTLDLPADIRPEVLTSEFLLTLARLDGGRFVQACSENLVQLTSACDRLTAKGKLAVTLEAKPVGRSESGYTKMALTPTLKTTVPQEKAQFTLLYVGDKHDLQASDPQQEELELKNVTMMPMAVVPKAVDEMKMKKA